MPCTPDDTTLLRARTLDRSGLQDTAVRSVGPAPSVIKQLARLLARQAAREWLQESQKEMERVP